ncbi:MAG: hypothetical protein AB1806_10445 [Acidobacteriota bacterium]
MRVGSNPRPVPPWEELFRLLRQIEPIGGLLDVEWHGPYFIPRPKEWCLSHFLLYGGRVYGSIQIDWTTLTATWEIDSGEVSYEGTTSSMEWRDPEHVWQQALPQFVSRLRSAVVNPSAFNRRMQRLIPLEARTGRVVRKWTWPKGTRPPLSRAQNLALEAACRHGETASAWPSLTSNAYLDLAARMYDAAFPELRARPPREKHAAKADTRHGGMLDLPQDDPSAFRQWYSSRVWSGCHPWEIVFGHPHGILFSPSLDDQGGWRFYLSVDSTGLYLRAAKMAVALGEANVPFLLHKKAAVVAALRGLDDVEVGPGYGQFPVARLREERLEGIAHVRWDPIPEIRPITPLQRRRVDHVLRTGSPAGWPAHESHSETDL